MREYKFRAWHKEFKDYYNVEEIYFGIKQLSLCGKRPNHDEPEIIFRAKFEDVILEQYTGLKDKNGVEIYEGDLLKTALMVGRVIYHSTVSGGIGYYVEFNNSIEPLENMINSYEITGNIHEGVESDE